MTIKQFLEELQQTPRDWRITKPGECVIPGAIRRGKHTKFNNDYQCPLGAVALPGKPACRTPLEYGLQLGLSEDDILAILRAADHHRSSSDSTLRQQLLAACGL
jgi:hypothetical protein